MKVAKAKGPAARVRESSHLERLGVDSALHGKREQDQSSYCFTFIVGLLAEVGCDVDWVSADAVAVPAPSGGLPDAISERRRYQPYLY